MTVLRLLGRPDSERNSGRVPRGTPRMDSKTIYATAIQAASELLHGITTGDRELEIGALRRFVALGPLCQAHANHLERRADS